MSRLDLAKMTVESITKMLERRVQEHNLKVQTASTSTATMEDKNHVLKSHQNVGFGYCPPDQFLLLSTGRQRHHGNNSLSSSNKQKLSSSSSIAACAAGGRLLVGYKYNDTMGDNNNNNATIGGGPGGEQYAFLHSRNNNNSHHHESFERELKRLRPTVWNRIQPQKQTQQQNPKQQPFPEDGGGAIGLNAALSAGLQLLSRYRLQYRCTENFGMGRLPSSAILQPTTVIPGGAGSAGPGGGSNVNNATLQPAVHALQPACLILLTDGECLRRPAAEGGGPLQLQFGNLPLREFYQEPFRWDQRIFCLGVGSASSDKLHPSLKAFCEVTGGCHLPLSSVSNIPQVSETLLHIIAPSVPKQLPIPNPLRVPSLPPITIDTSEINRNINCMAGGTYVNGGPICCFQHLEGGGSNNNILHRAMLLYTPYHMDVLKMNNTTTSNSSSNNQSNNNSLIHNAPIWCIPESFFPNKKMDTLPPRSAQPKLYYSRHYQVVGSAVFDPFMVMKLLHRLDQILISIRQIYNNTSSLANAGCGKEVPLKMLQRDVYICEWSSQDGGTTTTSKMQSSPFSQPGQEHFPVCVRGGGRSSLSDDDENVLNIGILHIPISNGNSNGQRISTLTLLPPEPHIVLPLLVKAAEMEVRALKKVSDKKDVVNNQHLVAASRTVPLDENWRSEFRAYLFRIPPYYQHSLRRCLRPILPASVHSLFNTESLDSVPLQCFSRQCLQKIRNGELFAKNDNEMSERHEAEYRKHIVESQNLDEDTKTVGYGQYDVRTNPSSYLAALRNMPPPWRVGNNASVKKGNNASTPTKSGYKRGSTEEIGTPKLTDCPVTESLGNLPHQCLLAYYESRRRWIFGGTGLTTRGLSVEGVNNDGTNCHHYRAKYSIMDESLLSVAGVGASMLNKTAINKMGDFKERLLWSRQPVVGYGANDSTGSAITTAADGSPVWSVDNDALPLNFFNAKTGEFSDSIQTRVRTRLSINFGNPYKDKRGDSLIPENFQDQRPPLHQDQNINLGSPSPPTSPPHADTSYSSDAEGEGEAVFAGIIPPSPSRKNSDASVNKAEVRKRVLKAEEELTSQQPKAKKTKGEQPRPPPPPPKSEQSMKQKSPPPPPPPQKQLKRSTSLSKQKPPPPPPPPQKNSITPVKKKRPPPPPPKPAGQGVLSPKQPSQTKTQPSQQTKPRTTQQPPPPPSEVQSPNVKPKVKLPPGWITVWSKSQKRWYYFDQNTNKSVWQWPPPPGSR